MNRNVLREYLLDLLLEGEGKAQIGKWQSECLKNDTFRQKIKEITDIFVKISEISLRK